MKLRLLTGRVVVRELPPEERSGRIWMPDPKQDDVRTHRGVVLAVGPAPDGARLEFGVGDVVQYHFSTHNERAWTLEWPEDGKPATWIPWWDVDLVWGVPTVAEAVRYYDEVTDRVLASDQWPANVDEN